VQTANPLDFIICLSKLGLKVILPQARDMPNHSLALVIRKDKPIMSLANHDKIGLSFVGNPVVYLCETRPGRPTHEAACIVQDLFPKLQSNHALAIGPPYHQGHSTT
jgi:hypothetical protein